MSIRILASAAAVAFALLSAPAGAVSLGTGTAAVAPPEFAMAAQYRPTREFRRCMRAKYGPRYFARVPRTHRFHMAQACGG